MTEKRHLPHLLHLHLHPAPWSGMEWNGADEWNGVEWSGRMEWSGMERTNGMEWNGMGWDGVESGMEWNRFECDVNINM
jgi:hypothetical protein